MRVEGLEALQRRTDCRNRGGSRSVASVGWLAGDRAMGTLSAVPVQARERPPPEAQGVEGRSWKKGVAVALAGSAATAAEGTAVTCPSGSGRAVY